MNRRYLACCIGLCLGLLPSLAVAGSISGIVKELRGTDGLPNVTITVTDISNNAQLPLQFGKQDGTFTVSLPDGVGVRVDFQDGVHTPAALVGISGSVVLSNFPIFMPGLMQKQTPCCCYYCRRRRCRR
jgi:hypothetical protein